MRSPRREAGHLINQTVTLRTITHSRHSRTGITASLLLLSTTTELVPTDDGVRATPADPAVPSKAARSTENGFPLTVLEVTRHLAGHVSVGGVRPLESSPDDPPDNRYRVLPSGSKTTSSIRSLRYLPAPDWEASNKTPAHDRLRGPECRSQLLPSRCLASPTFAGEHANHML